METTSLSRNAWIPLLLLAPLSYPIKSDAEIEDTEPLLPPAKEMLTTASPSAESSSNGALISFPVPAHDAVIRSDFAVFFSM